MGNYVQFFETLQPIIPIAVDYTILVFVSTTLLFLLVLGACRPRLLALQESATGKQA